MAKTDAQGNVYLVGPDGSVAAIPPNEVQQAADAGWTPADDAQAKRAQIAYARHLGLKGAAQAGVMQAAPEEQDLTSAFAERVASNLTFGFGEGLDSPAAIGRARDLEQNHTGLAMGADLVGSLPYAAMTGAAGGALTTAARGAGLLARGGALAADVGVNALVGGAQIEGERVRQEGGEFDWTSAALTGVAGEVLGRGVWNVPKLVGGARNLLARAERDIVAADAAKSLERGGWVQDYRTAAHAETYHDQLAELAAADLDRLETNFAEVSRQDRKRARILKTVRDNPQAQQEIAVTAAANLRQLRDALSDELEQVPGGRHGEPGPGRKLLKQLDERIAKLDDAPTGKKLWQTLDENRQALQEYAQDLHQSYADNPGSAWLSREGLAAVDGAEKFTREALLRGDAWGEAAAQMQRQYNEPFHGKWFPARETVLKELHFAPQRDARGFHVYRGEPGKVKRFLTRGADDLDGKRLAEYWDQYLEGAEAIAKAGEKDSPKAAREVLEAVRRLRKARANAAQVSAAAERTAGRTGALEVAGQVAGGIAGGALGGGLGAAGGMAAVRAVKVGDWLAKAGRKLGLFGGKPLDMAELLAKDALPEAAERDARQSLLDDILDGPPPPSKPPSGPAGAPPPESGYKPLPKRPRPAGLEMTPSVARELGREMPGAQATAADALGDSGVRLSAEPESILESAGPIEDVTSLPAPGPRDRPTVARVGGGIQEEIKEGVAQYDDVMTPGRAARVNEAKRLEALTQDEFKDVVERLRTAGSQTPEGESIAEILWSNKDKLAALGFIVGAGALAAAEGEGSEGAMGAGAGALGLLAALTATGRMRLTKLSELGLDASQAEAATRMFRELTAGATGREELQAAAEEVFDAFLHKPAPGDLPQDTLYSLRLMFLDSMGRQERQQLAKEMAQRGISQDTLEAAQVSFRKILDEADLPLRDQYRLIQDSLKKYSNPNALASPAAVNARVSVPGKVHDGEWFGRLGPQAREAVEALQSLGFDMTEAHPKMIVSTFGGAAVPTPEQWARLIPIEQLEKLAPMSAAIGRPTKPKMHKMGDGMAWYVDGPVTKHSTEGYEAEAWKMGRTFERTQDGLEVYHDFFYIRDDLQAGGIGAAVLKAQMEAYREIGVSKVHVSCDDVGKYFWPSLGFNHPDPKVIQQAVSEYQNWVMRKKLQTSDEVMAATRSVKSLPSLAQAEYGKEFLLEKQGPWNLHLELDLKDENPLFHLMRQRLGIADAPASAIRMAPGSEAAVDAGWAAMGGVALVGYIEGSAEDAKSDETTAAAGAMAPMALFGRRMSLFRAARTKLVADVARKLFSAAGQPMARAAGRIAYDRATMRRRQEEFQSWQANPQELVDRVAEGFRDVPPDAQGDAAAGVFRTATFLKQRLPSVVAMNAVSLRQIPVSVEQMQKFARYEQAALRPREALAEAASRGYMSTELLETVTELYPDLLAELRVQAMLQVQESGPPPSVQAKLAYARLFDGQGEYADPAFSKNVAEMANYAYEQTAQPKQGGGPTSSGNVSHAAAASGRPAGLARLG